MAWMLKTVWPTFQIGAIEGEAVTRDETVAKRNSTDILTYQGGFKIGHAYVLLKSCANLQKRLNEVRLPILVLQGEKDEIVSPEAAQKIVQDCSSIDKKYVAYPDAKHALHVELPDVKRDVLNRISVWLIDHSEKVNTVNL